MPNSTEKSVSVLSELLGKIAAELAMIEAGKDSGLPAIFSDVMELGKLVNEPGVPDAIRDGALPPRKWLDDILDTTAVFDTLTITRLSEWFGWFESALGC